MKSYNKEFLKLSAVTMVQVIATYFAELTDQLVAAHMLGNAAFAGVGLAQPITMIMETFSALFYVGAGVRFFAAKETGSEIAVRKVFSTAFHIAAIGGAVFALLILGNRWSVASFFGAGSDVTCYNAAYLKYYVINLALLPISALLLEILLCEGDYRRYMLSQISQLVVNAVASLILCRFYGIEGIALGSVLAYIVSVSICASHFIMKRDAPKLDVIFSPLEAWRMTIGSVGDMCYPFFQAATAAVVVKLVTLRFGGEMTPLATVMVDIVNFGMIFETFGEAIDPVLGKAYAHRDFPAIRGVLKTATLAMAAVAVAVGAFFALAPEPVIGFLGLEVAEFGASAERIVRIMGAMFLAIGFVNLYNTCYQFVDHPFISFFLTLFGGFAGPVAAIAVAPAEKGIEGFAAFFASGYWLGVFAFLLMILFVRRGRSFPLLIREDELDLDDDEDLVKDAGLLPFRLTPKRIALVGAAIFLLLTVPLFYHSYNGDLSDVEVSLENQEHRFQLLGQCSPSEETLIEYATNTYLYIDLGDCFILDKDGETIISRDEEYTGENAFEIGYDRAAIDAGRTFDGVVSGARVKYRIFTVSGRRIILSICDFDMNWDTNHQMSLSAISLLIIIAALVFIISASLRQEEESVKG